MQKFENVMFLKGILKLENSKFQKKIDKTLNRRKEHEQAHQSSYHYIK